MGRQYDSCLRAGYPDGKLSAEGFRVVQKCHDRSSGVGPIYRDPRPTTLPFHGLFGQDGGEGGSQDTARHIQPRRRLQTAPLSKLESGRFKNGTGKHPVERHHSCNMDSANQKRDVKASELSSRSTSLKVAHRFKVRGVLRHRSEAPSRAPGTTRTTSCFPSASMSTSKGHTSQERQTTCLPGTKRCCTISCTAYVMKLFEPSLHSSVDHTTSSVSLWLIPTH